MSSTIDDAFKKIPKEIVPLFRKEGEIKRFSEKQMVIKENFFCDGIYLLLSGFCSVVKTNSPNINFVYFLKQGEIIGIDHCNLNTPNTYGVKSLSESSFLFISKEKILKSVNDHPQLMLALLNVFSKNLSQLEQSNADKISLSLKLQLYQFFKKMNSTANSFGMKLIPIDRSIMINYFSCSKSSLSRMMSHYEELGVVKSMKKGFYIKNPEYLNSINFIRN